MGYKFIFAKNRQKTKLTAAFPPNPGIVERFDSEVRRSRCQSPAKLVQQSRALYRTGAAKVKRQKENGANLDSARFSPLPLVPALV
jgi:hypothetical protein